jgi:NTE family protein
MAVDQALVQAREMPAEVDLVDAVAASCALPGIWPPATIGARRFMDGGLRSSDNADLAEGAARIIVVSPLGLDSPLPTPNGGLPPYT